MYIQITERCNMNCAHCCMNATAKGRDMTRETFTAALENSPGVVTLGGGEPTLHPDFEWMLLQAIAHCDEGCVMVITNGSIKDRAIMLARLAKVGILNAELSQDPWHDEIDDDVVEAFTKDYRQPRHFYDHHDNRNIDRRGIRDVSPGVKKRGRAADWYDAEDKCACDGDAFVKPDGSVFLCGCDNARRLGDVFNGFESPEDWVCENDVENLTFAENVA